MATSQPENNVQQSSYIIAAVATPPTTKINNGNETPTFCDIKILCTQRKKKTKRYIYLTFVESCSLSSSSSNEQPCIEIIGKTTSPLILLNDCISFEYFDTTKNDFESFIYIYFESYTISIYFSDEHITKKPLIIKHLEYMYKKPTEKSTEINNQQSSQELPCLSTTEHIAHTFDVKLIPYETIISRDHILIGPARLYFTATDLYIASRDCNSVDLKTTITNQCPSKTKTILCIPYFTIKHYGNRSNIFLIELGKSNYGNGEIHMKCLSSSLASTIHLLVSPVIEERPLIYSSAFQDQLLTKKRIEKSKDIHPPIQLKHDTTDQSILDRSLPFLKKYSIESLPEQSRKLNEIKSRSVVGFFRKLIKNTNSLQRSCTFDTQQNPQSNILPSTINKFFELNIDEKKIPNNQQQIIPLKSQISNNKTNEIPLTSLHKQEITVGTYIDMGPTIQKSELNQQEEIKDESLIKEPTATVDIGVNTMISISPYVRSAIIVGTSVHLIAEEKAVFPIGQRSFTSPASVMQPFKAQLSGLTTIDTSKISTDMITCAPNSSSSFHQTTSSSNSHQTTSSSNSHQTTSSSNSHQSLFLSYGIVTFNTNSLLTDQTDYVSSLLSDGSTIDRRLNSDLSLMSISHQQQPSNISSLDNLLSASSSSNIFRRLSLSINNTGDNTSGRILFIDENLVDQTTTYLLESPSTTLIHDTNLAPSISRSPLSHINNKEKLSSDDSYAIIEPLPLHNASLPSLPMILTKPLVSSEKLINYTDLLLPTNPGDEQQQQECDSSNDNLDQFNDLIEEKTERSSTILYTDIDFHQTQRRDRIAQCAAISKIKDQLPPFIL